MASVLDVLETVKASISTPGKIVKASKMQIEAKTKLTEVEVAMSQASAEAGPSEPAKEKPSEIGEKAAEEDDDVIDNLLVHGSITHNALLADIFLACFKLRLD